MSSRSGLIVRFALAATLGAAVMPALAHAEVLKVAVLCSSGVCPRWWPVLPEVAGWRQDREQSEHDGVNAQVPDGEDFESAEVVIYARAVLKTEGGAELDAFIARDQAETRAQFPGTRIKEEHALQTADAQHLRSFAFAPHDSGNWELVSYGEEGDYYLLFAISSRSKEGLVQRRADYLEFVRRYRAVP